MIFFEKKVIEKEKVINYFFLDRYERIVMNEIKRDESSRHEKHHIVPKCMGRSDDFNNIVKCRLRVHFILHFLLSKAFPCNRGLITSCLYFKKARNSRLYEIMKKHHSRQMIENNPAKRNDVREKISQGILNRNLLRTDEEQEKIKRSLSKRTQERIKNKTHNFIKNHPMKNGNTKDYILSNLNSQENRKITSERQKKNNSIIGILKKIEKYMIDNCITWDQAAIECKNKKITRAAYSEATYIKWLKSKE